MHVNSITYNLTELLVFNFQITSPLLYGFMLISAIIIILFDFIIHGAFSQRHGTQENYLITDGAVLTSLAEQSIMHLNHRPYGIAKSHLSTSKPSTLKRKESVSSLKHEKLFRTTGSIVNIEQSWKSECMCLTVRGNYTQYISAKNMKRVFLLFPHNKFCKHTF